MNDAEDREREREYADALLSYPENSWLMRDYAESTHADMPIRVSLPTGHI